jgi:hypothetical protein
MTVRHLLFHNFWLKLLSLALAAVIWSSIKRVQADLSPPQPSVLNPTQRNVRLVVDVLAQPGDARIFKITPDSVTVTINGEDAVLRKYSGKDLRAYIDLTRIRATEPTTYEVRIHTPPDVTVRTVAPQVVAIEQISP